MYKYNPERIAPPFKLQNSGTSCYINSIVQCLISLPAFNNLILIKYAQNSNNDVIKCFYYLIANAGINKLMSAAHISAALTQNNTDFAAYHMGSNTQEDASEALKLILEYIGDDFAALFHIRHKMTLKCMKCAHKISANAVNEIFIDISRQMSSKAQIEKYIMANVVKPEDYRCENCGDSEGAVYQVYCLKKTSSVIILSFHSIQYNRVAYYFPPELSFPSAGAKLIYKAVAKIEHFGNINAGHYTATCDRGPQQDLRNSLSKYANIINNSSLIFKMSDTNIKCITKPIEPSPNTYMVFYHLL